MIDIIRKLITWLAMGLFVGGGFAVAMYAVGYWATDIYAGKVQSMVEEQGEDAESTYISSYISDYKEYGPDAGLTIQTHKPRSVPDSLNVLGTIKNEGKDAWASVQLEVELFDASGGFVDECSEYMNGTIAPGEVENFKVSCGRCDRNPLPDYENYTIRIRDAHYKPGERMDDNALQSAQ